MDILSLVVSLLQSLSSVPVVGKVLVYIVLGAGALVSLASAVVAIWHGIVLLLNAVAVIFPGVKALADKLAADEQKIQDFENNKLLPILNRLSVIPLPQK